MTRSFQPASYSAIQSVYSGVPSAQSYGNLGEVSNYKEKAMPLQNLADYFLVFFCFFCFYQIQSVLQNFHFIYFLIRSVRK